MLEGGGGGGGGGGGHLADDVDVATDGRYLVLHYAHLLEECLHVLALATAAAFKICIRNRFRNTEFAKAVHHLNVAAVVLEQQRVLDARNF
jgi:hypothetical protein